MLYNYPKTLTDIKSFKMVDKFINTTITNEDGFQLLR